MWGRRDTAIKAIVAQVAGFLQHRNLRFELLDLLVRALLELAISASFAFHAVLQLRDQLPVLVKDLSQLPFEVLERKVARAGEAAGNITSKHENGLLPTDLFDFSELIRMLLVQLLGQEVVLAGALLQF